MRTRLAVALAWGCLSCGAAPPGSSPDLGGAPERGPALRVVVRSGDDMQPLPSRLLITALPPTPRPTFRSDGYTTVEIAPGVLGDPEGVLLVTGQARLPLAAGVYDVRVVQGPEHEVVQRRVTIGPEEVAVLDVTLEHSVRTDGWLAADMHIHSAPRSFDSRLAAAHRVVSEVTAGVELLVPTEHVNHNDLQPEVQLLGYGGRAVAIPGSEYGFRDGHVGVFPVRFDPQGRLFGAPDWEEWPWHGIDPETYFPLIHALPGEPVIVVNHPRLAPDLGYFRNIRWQPGAPLPTANLFEGLEVLAGYEQRPQEVTALLRDWFYLLGQGHRVTALGNSDTHRLDWLRAGYPRTWLRLPTEEPARVLPGDLRAAIRGMRAIASNGPFVKLTVEGKEIGETAAAQRGKVRVAVEADAAGWIDLTRVQLYLSGALLREIPIERRGHPALRQELEVEVAADGYLVALALGDQPLPTSVIGAVLDGKVKPVALTNPVWIDADGDGRVRPPGGIPRPAPWGAAAEPRSPSPLEELLTPRHAPLDCEPATWVDALGPGGL